MKKNQNKSDKRIAVYGEKRMTTADVCNALGCDRTTLIRNWREIETVAGAATNVIKGAVNTPFKEFRQGYGWNCIRNFTTNSIKIYEFALKIAALGRWIMRKVKDLLMICFNWRLLYLQNRQGSMRLNGIWDTFGKGPVFGQISRILAYFLPYIGNKTLKAVYTVTTVFILYSADILY